jgi:urease accessory protein
MRSLHWRVGVLLGGLALQMPAAAHEQAGVAGGLLSGLLHPVTGLDHLVAMVAVGLWGAQLGAPALWLLPIAFPLLMALGGVLGVLGVPLPAPEIAIALSALTLGCLVAARVRLSLSAACAIVSVFALFHGHAHGSELPQAADPLAYGVGFVVATGVLHLCGIAIGTLTHRVQGDRLVRVLGGAIAVTGAYFLALGLGALR